MSEVANLAKTEISNKNVCAQLCPTLCDPMDYSYQAPLSMGLPKQEYWSGLPFPSSGDFPNTGIKPESPALASGFLTTEQPGNPQPVSLSID